MLRECFGELCAVLGVSGVAGRGSTVPDSSSSSSVRGFCPSSLALPVLVPSTWLCLRRPLVFGRKQYPCVMIGYAKSKDMDMEGVVEVCRLETCLSG